MTAWKYHWQSFQNGPKLATEKGTHHRPSRKGTWTAKKYLDIVFFNHQIVFFCVLPCMSRGSHRELAINEGKSDEVQTEHLPSFPLLDVVIAEVCQEHGLTLRPLSPFTTIFGIRVWTVATAAGASGGSAKGGRVGRSGLGHFTSSQIRGNPIINLKLAWLIFRMCSMMAYTLAWSKRPKPHLKVFKQIWYWFNKRRHQINV